MSYVFIKWSISLPYYWKSPKSFGERFNELSHFLFRFWSGTGCRWPPFRWNKFRRWSSSVTRRWSTLWWGKEGKQGKIMGNFYFWWLLWNLKVNKKKTHGKKIEFSQRERVVESFGETANVGRKVRELFWHLQWKKVYLPWNGNGASKLWTEWLLTLSVPSSFPPKSKSWASKRSHLGS